MEGWRNLGVALHAEVGQYVSGMRLAAAETKDWARQTVMAGEEAAVAFRKQNAGLDAMGGKLTRRVTLPILAAAGASVKLAYDFNQSFSKIEALADVPASAIRGIKDEVLGLSDATGVDATKLANALLLIMRAGLRGADAMAVLTAAAKGSALGMGEASDVAMTITSAMHAYSASHLTASRTLDILTTATKRSDADVSKFGPALGALIPVAADLGISFDQVSGSLAYLTKNAGGNVAVAASGLRFILQQLVKVGAPAQKALHGVGMSADSLRADIADRGLIPALSDLQDRLGGGSQALLKVFPNARAVSGIVALLANNGKAAAGDIDAMTKSTGAADTAIVKLNKTDTQKLRKDFAQLKNAGIRLGDDLLPVITKIVGGVSWMGREFGHLPAAGKDIALVGLGILALAGPLLKVIALATKLHAAWSRMGDAKAFREGLAGLRGEATGAESSVGGLAMAMPALGIAAVGAGLGLYAWKIQADAARERAEKLASIVTSLRQLMEGGKSPMEAFKEGALLDFSVKHHDILKELGISPADLAKALSGTSDAFLRFTNQKFTGKSADAHKLIGDLALLRDGYVKAQAEEKADAAARRSLGLATQDSTRLTDANSAAVDANTGKTKRNGDAIKDNATASLQAWQASRQRFDAAEKERTGLEGVHDAEESLAAARRTGAESVDSARRQEVTAERSLISAQRDSLQAQKDLNQARKDAVRNLRDLKNAAIDAAFGERSAQFALMDAQQAIDNMPLDATDEDRAKAQLALEQAQQALVEAGQSKGDANQALADGPAQNAANIAAAQQRVTDAVTAESDARRGVADAARATKQAQLDAAKSVKDAQDKLTQSQLAYIQTLDDEGASHLQLTDSIIAGYLKVAATMDENSPLRKNLVAYIKGLLLAKAMQDATGTSPATPTKPTTPTPPGPDGVPGHHVDPTHEMPSTAGSGYTVPGKVPDRSFGNGGFAPRAWPTTKTADVPERPAASVPAAQHTTNIYTSDAKRYYDRAVFDS